MYAFKCGDDSKNKLKGLCESQSKNINFEEYKKRLDGNDYQKNVINMLFDFLIMKCKFRK